MTYIPGAGMTWEEIKSKLESEGAKNKVYDSDVDGVLDLGAIPTITRDKLEYPTEDVNFAYLAAINKCGVLRTSTDSKIGEGLIGTFDNFTDKQIKYAIDIVGGGYSYTYARWNDPDNFYYARGYHAGTGSYVYIYKYVNGSCTTLASNTSLPNISDFIRFSISGSTLKFIYGGSTTSAADTTFASGKFGVKRITTLLVDLLLPATTLPQPKTIIEAEVIGSGLEDNPFRPNLKQLLDETKNINKLAVTWGAFDHKSQHNTMLITITGGNPYTGEKAIQEQIEYAKSKNLKVLKPPRDYSEAIEQYKQLRQEFTEWIAGKDNYAYQTLGHEVFEHFQVADTYHGNIVEGYKPDAYKNVPDWEMRKTLAMWKERLKRAEVAKLEAEKHLKKLEEVEKKGW